MRALELVYSVNGGPGEDVVLHRGRGRKSVSAGHTFFLEELTLEPGDFISYFARAADESAAPPGRSTTRHLLHGGPAVLEGVQAGGGARGEGRGAGGGDGGASPTSSARSSPPPSRSCATASGAEAKQIGRGLATLALMQGRLQDQVSP